MVMLQENHRMKTPVLEIQNGWSLAAQACSPQWKCKEQEDATLSDEFLLLTDQEIPSRGAPQVASVTLVVDAAVLLAPQRSGSWCRVNGTRSLFGQRLELWEGRVAYSADWKRDSRRKPDWRFLGRKAPWILTPVLAWHSGLLRFWPWESTSWTSTQRPNLKVGNYKDDRWINLQWWEETSVKRLRIPKIRMPLPLQRITVPH